MCKSHNLPIISQDEIRRDKIHKFISILIFVHRLEINIKVAFIGPNPGNTFCLKIFFDCIYIANVLGMNDDGTKSSHSHSRHSRHSHCRHCFTIKLVIILISILLTYYNGVFE